MKRQILPRREPRLHRWRPVPEDAWSSMAESLWGYAESASTGCTEGVPGRGSSARRVVARRGGLLVSACASGFWILGSTVTAIFSASGSRGVGTQTQTACVPSPGLSQPASMWSALSARTTSRAARLEDAWSNTSYYVTPHISYYLRSADQGRPSTASSASRPSVSAIRSPRDAARSPFRVLPVQRGTARRWPLVPVGLARGQHVCPVEDLVACVTHRVSGVKRGHLARRRQRGSLGRQPCARPTPSPEPTRPPPARPGPLLASREGDLALIGCAITLGAFLAHDSSEAQGKTGLHHPIRRPHRRTAPPRPFAPTDVRTYGSLAYSTGTYRT